MHRVGNWSGRVASRFVSAQIKHNTSKCNGYALVVLLLESKYMRYDRPFVTYALPKLPNAMLKALHSTVLVKLRVNVAACSVPPPSGDFTVGPLGGVSRLLPNQPASSDVDCNGFARSRLAFDSKQFSKGSRAGLADTTPILTMGICGSIFEVKQIARVSPQTTSKRLFTLLSYPTGCEEPRADPYPYISYRSQSRPHLIYHAKLPSLQTDYLCTPDMIYLALTVRGP
jgi:hypothetical protein